VALFALGLNHGLLALMFKGELAQARLAEPESSPSFSRRAKLTLAVIAASAVAYTLGGDLAWTAASGFVLLMLLHRRDTRELWPRIDWALLVFFSGLFVVVAGLSASGAPALFFERFPLASGSGSPTDWLRLATIFLVGSNVVSNVPFILVVRDQMATLPDPKLGWEMLSMASTFAGNLTLLGSVANVIVAEAAHEVGGIGFWQYLKVGFPLAITTTLAGVGWLLLIGR
jgi:Na+/H+ antiporter NhaD/arsenite permease-like protein